MNLMSLTAVELGKKIKSGEVKVVDAVNDAFAHIEKQDKTINSFVTVTNKEEALKKAEEVQKLIDEGKLTGPRNLRARHRYNIVSIWLLREHYKSGRVPDTLRSNSGAGRYSSR